jgi:hypothetical protein
LARFSAAQSKSLTVAEKQSAVLESKGIISMPESERLTILSGLKKNWQKLNFDYQKLSLTVDTVPKIARKVNMEKELKEYEGLIEKFDNTHILVNFSV